MNCAAGAREGVGAAARVFGDRRVAAQGELGEGTESYVGAEGEVDARLEVEELEARRASARSGARRRPSFRLSDRNDHGNIQNTTHEHDLTTSELISIKPSGPSRRVARHRRSLQHRCPRFFTMARSSCSSMYPSTKEPSRFQ